MILSPYRSVYRSSESGNVFFAIFGAVAVLGILGASVMTFMKGPLATSVKITRQNVAENQMLIGAQVAIMAAASQADNGDCDGDTVVEPIPWRDAGVDPKPVGGGLVPLSIGINKKDPYGTDYGYCVWDHGTLRNNALCGVGAGRLAGTTVGSSYPVVALVSAGADKTFNTTCRTFADADSNTDFDLLDAGDHQLVEKTTGSDDIIFTYTYEEATNASGGLWSLKSGHPDTAVIGKDIEVTGTGMFDRLGATGNDYLELVSGMKFANPSTMPVCNATNASVVRMNASNNGLEMCDGVSLWKPISGGDTSAFANNNLPCDATNKGKVRYNSSTAQPEFCNGTQWLPFTINTPGVNLVITATSGTPSAMNVDGANNLDTTTCTALSAYYCGAEVTFVVNNQGTLISNNLFISLTNSTNFAYTLNTCTVGGGNADGKLSPNETCTIKLRPKSNGNQTYTGNLRVTANNNPFVIMQGESTNFGCLTGRQGGGGYYLSCGQNDGDGPYDLVIMPSGCNGSITNPTCSGGTDTGAVARVWGAGTLSIPQVCVTNQICKASQDSVNIEYLRAQYGYSFPANSYCQDMQYNGKTDWYLPDQWELQTVLYNAIQTGKLSGFAGDYYYTATLSSNSPSTQVTMYRPYDNRVESYYDSPQMNYSRYVRCVRREDLALRAVSNDADPDNVTFGSKTTFISGERVSSTPVAFSGFLQPVSVSISGAGSPRIKINGGSETSSGIINPGNTIQMVMDAPTVLSTKNNATLTVGPDVYNWWVGYADQTRTLTGFVTSTTYRGDQIGGLSGGDAACNARAEASTYGLSSKYIFVASNSTINAIDRIPWSWGTLKMVDGTVIVNNGVSDLFDGTIMNPLNLTEFGTISTNYPWTNSLSTGIRDNYGGGNNGCSDWTGNVYSDVISGSSGASSGAWLAWGGNGCGNYRPLICFENIDSTVLDQTPGAIRPRYALQVAPGSRQSTPEVVISGMSAGASTTLSVTATGGNPTFTLNGGAEVTTATVLNGSKVKFFLDAPATTSANYKMTITSSSPSTAIGYWRVWSGDPTGSVVKRVFVTSTNWGGNLGGVAGADSKCQAQAATAALGGTWKAIISGFAESEWAVNRIGYNWSTLKLVDNTTVVANAGGIWQTAIGQNLLAPINKTQAGAIVNVDTFTNTNEDGGVLYSGSSSNGCYDWSSSSQPDWNTGLGRSGNTGAAWIQGGSMGGYPCSDGHYLFCIEQ